MHYEPSWAPQHLQPGGSEDGDDFLEDAGYRRETPASSRNIKRLHSTLSNRFRRWLNSVHKIAAKQEKRRVDISFSQDDRTHLAELKVCYGGYTKASIREALGQIFEYNLYPPRQSADSWLIVLDTKPAKEDVAYFEVLRQKYKLPLSLVWPTDAGFESDRPFLN